MSALGEDQTMIQVKVSKKTKKQLKEIASKQGKDLSAFIRDALEYYIVAIHNGTQEIDMWDAIGESGKPRNPDA